LLEQSGDNQIDIPGADRGGRGILATSVGFEPPPGFRVDDRDALADDISTAADHTMRVVAACSRGDLMALKRVAADRPYDRSGAPASSRDQHRRFGHAVEGTHHPRLERPITDLTVGQPRRDVARALIELCERQNRFFLPLIRQEYVGAVVRLLRGPITK